MSTGVSALKLTAAWVTRTTLRVLYAPLKLLPTRRKVTMLSRESSTVPADFADIAEAIARQDPTVTVIIHARMVPPGLMRKIGYAVHLVRQLIDVATSRVLIIDTYSIVASVLRHKKSLTVLQIWHALGAFKKFGLSIIGHEEGTDPRLAQAMRMHEGYDVVLVSSEAARAPYAEALGTPLERVQVAPLPRVDRMRDPAITQATRDRIYTQHPHLYEQKVAVYAPTFRGVGSLPVDFVELSEALYAAGVHLVVKAHPLTPTPQGVDTLLGFSTQDAITIADIFITDYSTVLSEAALYEVPSYFLAPDLDEYVGSRGFYLDYEGEMPGPIVSTAAELAEAVAGQQATRESSVAFAERWVEVPGVAAPRAGATPCTDEIVRIVLEHC